MDIGNSEIEVTENKVWYINALWVRVHSNVLCARIRYDHLYHGSIDI